MYDPMKTVKKFLWAAGPGILFAGLAAAHDYTQGNAEMNWEAVFAAFLGGLAVGLKNYLAHGGKASLKPPTSVTMIALVAGACFLFSGCAFTRQSVRTMDGDEFSQFAGSTLGKQDAAQDISADFYPNNSGASIQVGGETQQDATAMVPIIQALISALTQQQPAGGGGTAPVERGRIEQLEAQIASLHRIIEQLRGIGGVNNGTD